MTGEWTEGPFPTLVGDRGRLIIQPPSWLFRIRVNNDLPRVPIGGPAGICIGDPGRESHVPFGLDDESM